MTILNCKICGKEFKAFPYRIKNGSAKFCSSSCYFISKVGKKLPDNHPFKIGKPGVENAMFGRHHTKTANMKNRLAHLGKHASPLTEFKKNQMKRENNVNWKGGVTFLPEYNQAQTSKRSRLIKNGGKFSLIEWLTLKEKYNFSCLCCKQQEPLIRLSPDHIIPISRGGKNTIDNIQPLCSDCNSRKWAKTIDYRIGKANRKDYVATA